MKILHLVATETNLVTGEEKVLKGRRCFTFSGIRKEALTEAKEYTDSCHSRLVEVGTSICTSYSYKGFCGRDIAGDCSEELKTGPFDSLRAWWADKSRAGVKKRAERTVSNIIADNPDLR